MLLFMKEDRESTVAPSDENNEQVTTENDDSKMKSQRKIPENFDEKIIYKKMLDKSVIIKYNNFVVTDICPDSSVGRAED